MMAIIVLAVVAAIALPSFRDFIVKNQIKASAEAIQNAIQLARGEAVRINDKVRFTLGNGTSWSINVDNGGALVQQSRASGEGGSSGVISSNQLPSTAATQITFNGFGRIVPNTNTTATLTSVDVSVSGAPANTALRIQISSPGGQVRLCSPSITSTTDPRRCL
jgi:type IV fimbrial biogenesis protein FimT